MTAAAAAAAAAAVKPKSALKRLPAPPSAVPAPALPDGRQGEGGPGQARVGGWEGEEMEGGREGGRVKARTREGGDARARERKKRGESEG